MQALDIALEEQRLLAQLADPPQRERAFRELVKRYQQRIYWHVRKMVVTHEDADDLVQETFIRAWHALPQFEGKSRLYTWLYRIATNLCLNFLERKKRRFFLPIHDVGEELGSKLDQAPLLDGDEIQRRLQKAVLMLPPKQQLVFNMRYYEVMDYESISEVLGTSVGGLKASYHHAVKKIETLLTERTI